LSGSGVEVGCGSEMFVGGAPFAAGVGAGVTAGSGVTGRSLTGVFAVEGAVAGVGVVGVDVDAGVPCFARSAGMPGNAGLSPRALIVTFGCVTSFDCALTSCEGAVETGCRSTCIGPPPEPLTCAALRPVAVAGVCDGLTACARSAAGLFEAGAVDVPGVGACCGAACPDVAFAAVAAVDLAAVSAWFG